MNRKIFYIGGSPCSGKSTIAELFAKQVKRDCDKNEIFCMINNGSRAPKELYEIVKCNFGL